MAVQNALTQHEAELNEAEVVQESVTEDVVIDEAQKDEAEAQNNQEAVNIPNLIPLNSDITIGKSKIEQLTEELSEKAKQLEVRIGELEPKQDDLSLASDNIQKQVADLFDISVHLKEKISALEPEHHHLGRVTDELQDELEAQIIRIKDIESRLGSLEPRSEQLEIASKKLGEMSNRLVSKVNQLDTQLQQLEPAQQQLFEKTAELNNRTLLLEETSVDLAGKLKRSQIIFSVLLLLVIAGVTLVSFKGVDFVEQKWSFLKTTVFEQLDIQDQKIAQNRTKQQNLIQRLNTLQLEMEKNGVVSDELQSEYEALSAELQVISEKVAELSKKAREAEQRKIAKAPVELLGSEWILQQNPRHYAIQLVGVFNKQSAFDFATEHQDLLQEPVAWMKTSYANKDWYVLQYGRFTSFRKALAALKALPEPLQKSRPWIRSYQNLHDDIRQAKAKINVSSAL